MEFEVSDERRRQLELVASDRNSKVKHTTCDQTVLLSDDGLGATGIVAAISALKPADSALAGAVYV